MGVIYPLPEPERCVRCNAQICAYEIRERAPHVQAFCPVCRAFVRHVRRKELDLPKRPVRSSALTPIRRFRIMARDGMRCAVCARAAADGVLLQVDHILPVAEGGDDDDDNLITMCEECNVGKADDSSPRQLFLLWLKQRGHVNAQ